MRHCVASYARTRARGNVAIFSLKLDNGLVPCANLLKWRFGVMAIAAPTTSRQA